MSYLYGVRFKAAEDPLILALREVGVQLYFPDWDLTRNRNCMSNLMTQSIGRPSETMSPKLISTHLTASCSIFSLWS